MNFTSGGRWATVNFTDNRMTAADAAAKWQA